MAQLLTAFLLALPGLALQPDLTDLSGFAASHTTLQAPPKNKPVPVPKPATLTCKLLTTEAPRGGRLEVEGRGFGQAPLVRIGGRVARILERTGDRIAVQIHADSNGGPVSVIASKQEVACGSLTIIGKD